MDELAYFSNQRSDFGTLEAAAVAITNGLGVAFPDVRKLISQR